VRITPAERRRAKPVVTPSSSRRISAGFTGGRPRASSRGKRSMRSILLYLIGVPLPIILLLAFCTHHF
jgi:hypothetical protein